MLSGTSSLPRSRSVRSIRSLLPSKLNPSSDSLPAASSPLSQTDSYHHQSLKLLHLPPSIQSLERTSPALWRWIHSGDFTTQEEVENQISKYGAAGVGGDTKVVGYGGESVEVPLWLVDGDGMMIEEAGTGRGGSKWEAKKSV
ncbi:hypothetical protein HK104_005577, partial [Borealophlyctis nickersoniae]